MSNDQLREKLWEYAYGLLPDDEARALEEQICSDPQVARLYSEVQLQCDLVADAMRADLPSLQLQVSAEAGASAAPGVQRRKQQSPGPRTQSVRPWGNWLAAAAALLLACLLGTSGAGRLWIHNQSTELAQVDDVRASLVGPQQFVSGAPNSVTLVTRDRYEQPVSLEMFAQVVDRQDRVLWQQSGQTDVLGNWNMQLPADVVQDDIALVVRRNVDAREEIRAEFDVASADYVTHLATDRFAYARGESVRFRSVTLERASGNVAPPQDMHYYLVHPDDGVIVDGILSQTAERGVASGEIALPVDLADGKYQLVAESPVGAFRPNRLSLEVRSPGPAPLDLELAYAQKKYLPGEKVVADVQLSSNGLPAPGAVVNVRSRAANYWSTVVENATTDADGRLKLQFELPAQESLSASPVLELAARGAGETRRFYERVPVEIEDRVLVDFFPEGGHLIAGVVNRVYFQARSSSGDPVEIQGELRDEDNRTVAKLATDDPLQVGRGIFELTPLADRRYHVVVTDPQAMDVAGRLATAGDEYFACLRGEKSVLAADEGLQFSVASNQPQKPLVAVAACRGVEVGHLGFDSHADGHHRDYTMPLPENVQGVIRVTLFDFASLPPRAVAERLFYRRPAQRLQINVVAPDRILAGQDVDVELQVTDENGAAVDATLGVSVVEREVAAEIDAPGLVPTLMLLGEVHELADWEDANIYVEDSPAGEKLLDLLLGVQAWRRTEDVHVSMLAFADTAGMMPASDATQAGGFGGGGALPGLAGPPVASNAGGGTAGLGPATAMTADGGDYGGFDLRGGNTFEVAEAQPGQIVIPPRVIDNTQSRQIARSQASQQLERLETRQIVLERVTAGVAVVTLLLVVFMAVRRKARVWVLTPVIGLASAALLLGMFLWFPASSGRQAPRTVAQHTEENSDEMEADPNTLADSSDDRSEVGAVAAGRTDEAKSMDEVEMAQLEMAPQAAPALQEGLESLRPRSSAPPPAPAADRPAAPLSATAPPAPSIAPAPNQNANPDVMMLEKLDSGSTARDDDADAVRRATRQRNQSLSKANEQRTVELAGDSAPALPRAVTPSDAAYDTPAEHSFSLQLADKEASVRLAAERFAGEQDNRFYYQSRYTHESELGRQLFQPQVAKTLYWNPLLPVEEQQSKANIRWRAGEPGIVRLFAWGHAPGRIGDARKSLITEPASSRSNSEALLLTMGDRLNRALQAMPTPGGRALAEAAGAGGVESATPRNVPAAPLGAADSPAAGDTSDPQSAGARGNLGATNFGNSPEGGEQQRMIIVPRGYPVEQHFSGQLEGRAELKVAVPSTHNGMMKVEVNAYPSLASEILTAAQLLDPQSQRPATLLAAEKVRQWMVSHNIADVTTTRVLQNVAPLDVERISQLADAKDGVANKYGMNWYYARWLEAESGKATVTDFLDQLGDLADDAYRSSLAGRLAQVTDKRQGLQLLKELSDQQDDEGRVAARETMSGTGALSQSLETTALATLGWQASDEYREQADAGMDWLRRKRQAGGGWPTAESHALAVLALTGDTSRSIVAPQEATLQIRGDVHGDAQVPAHSARPLVWDSDLITVTGKQELQIELQGPEALKMPYNVGVTYWLSEPPADAQQAAPLKLQAQLAASQVQVGELVPLKVTVSGTAAPVAVVHIGIPAGLRLASPPAATFELLPGELILYFAAPFAEPAAWVQAADRLEFELQFRAVEAGSFEAPPSRAYPAHAPESVYWDQPLRVDVQ